jgi:hypothetical protein
MRVCFLVVPLLAAGVVPVSAQDVPQPQHASLLHVAAHAAGGALLGGWSGYMVAQVSWSDWQYPAGRTAQRIRFSVTGAALGALAGVMIARSAPGGAPAPGARPRVEPVTNRSSITAEEIRTSSARTPTELLRALRPQWLRSRGLDMLRVGTDSLLNEDPLTARGVRVYLNGGLLGGLEALDQVSLYTLTGVQFLGAAAATLRWGAGHNDGAILLLTSAAP